MKLTPLDIRKQEFEHSLRGYEPEEVKAFLQMLSEQWQTQIDEHRRLKEKVSDLKGKIRHYERVEEALQEAMQTARENKKQTLENAQREAELMVQEAEAEAEKIKQDAQEEHDRLRKEASKVGGRRQEIVARLRAFLMSEMELLAHFEGDDPVGFIKMLPPERRRRLREAGVTSNDAADDDRAGSPAERTRGSAEAAAFASEAEEEQEKGKERSSTPGSEGASAAKAEEAPSAPAAPAPQENPAAEEEEKELPDYLDRLSEEDEETSADAGMPGPPVSRQGEVPETAPQRGSGLEEAPDEQPSPGWIVNSLFSEEAPANERSGRQMSLRVEQPVSVERSGGAAGKDTSAADRDGEYTSASSEEIQKIRRILKSIE